jgi:hypothetical protein
MRVRSNPRGHISDVIPDASPDPHERRAASAQPHLFKLLTEQRKICATSWTVRSGGPVAGRPTRKSKWLLGWAASSTEPRSPSCGMLPGLPENVTTRRLTFRIVLLGDLDFEGEPLPFLGAGSSLSASDLRSDTVRSILKRWSRFALIRPRLCPRKVGSF